MSKNLTVRVSAKMYDLIQERANAQKISKGEFASIIFQYGMQSAIEELKKKQQTTEEDNTNEN